ncbi:MAG TPA: glycosyltransferase family 4 protein [Pirellulales bacterium]|nr:glycosyltransferase family 4 protein [Pirellulales bacterium]
MMRVTYYYPWGYFHPIRSGAATLAARHLEYFRSRGMRVRVLLCGDHPRAGRRDFERHYSWLEDLGVLDIRRHPSIASRFDRFTFADCLAGHTALGDLPQCRDFLSQDTDLVFLNYVFASPFLDLVPPAAKRVLETIDVLSKQFALRAGGPALLGHNLRVEFDLYELYDQVMMISQEEYELARARSGARVAYLARAVDTVSAGSRLEDTADDLFDLLFVGSDHPPNSEAIAWFYEHVFRPRLKRIGLRWAIAGSVCNHLSLSDPCVELLGSVDDLDAVYRRSKVVVVPLLSGTGISIKTLEALGRGKPVVATPVGLRGLSDVGDCVVAMPFEEQPEKVARCIRELCASQSLREQYGRRGLEYIRRNFSREGYERRMDELLAAVTGEPLAAAPSTPQLQSSAA